jgi:hypothetical protein
MKLVKYLIFALAALAGSYAQAADLEPFCRIEGGDAVAYLRNNTSSSVRVSGYIHFFFYDEDHDRIWDTRTPKHASIGARSVGEIGSYGAPDDAVSCSVDVSDAIDIPQQSYSTFCELRAGGEAVGFLRNQGDSSIRVSGPVTFTWYDDDGDRIWDTRTPKHATIQRGDTGEIGSYNGPDDAVSCSVDVSEAIE